MSEPSEVLYAVIGDINDAKLGLDEVSLRIKIEIPKTQGEMRFTLWSSPLITSMALCETYISSRDTRHSRPLSSVNLLDCIDNILRFVRLDKFCKCTLVVIHNNIEKITTHFQLGNLVLPQPKLF